MNDLNLEEVLASTIFDYKDKILFGQASSYLNKILVDHIPEDYDCAHVVIMKKEDMRDFLYDLVNRIEQNYQDNVKTMKYWIMGINFKSLS